MFMSIKVDRMAIIWKKVIHCIDEKKGIGTIIGFAENKFGYTLLIVKWANDKEETLHPSRVHLLFNDDEEL